MSTAVQIRTRSENDGGVLIRDWIKANYPGYTIQEQELIEQRDKAYNMITIIGPEQYRAAACTSTSRRTTGASATMTSPSPCR